MAVMRDEAVFACASGVRMTVQHCGRDALRERRLEEVVEAEYKESAWHYSHANGSRWDVTGDDECEDL